MITIKNTKLYNELKESAEWGVLFNSSYELKDERIPVFAGGLSHIVAKKRSIEFHDIGCNGRDNSFRIEAGE